jgi:hypothetical protein
MAAACPMHHGHPRVARLTFTVHRFVTGVIVDRENARIWN